MPAKKQSGEISMPQRGQERGLRGSRPAILGLVAWLFKASSYLWSETVRPLLAYLTTRNWVETPCMVVQCKIESTKKDRNRQDNSATKFRTKIEYEYVVEDAERHGDSNDPVRNPWTSDRAACQRLADRYPKGAQSVCFVDPQNPDRAVLDRELTTGTWIKLIGLPFFLGGVLGMTCCGALNRRRMRRGIPAIPALTASDGSAWQLQNQWSTPREGMSDPVVMNSSSLRLPLVNAVCLAFASFGLATATAGFFWDSSRGLGEYLAVAFFAVPFAGFGL